MKTLQLTQEALEEACLPKAFWSLGANTYFGHRLALKQTEQYVIKDADALHSGVGLLFLGPPSSLKTFLLTYALRCLMAKGHSVRYATTEEVTDLYFAREGRSLASELSHDRFLGVDNLGEVVNKATPTALRSLLRRRSDEGLCTLLATDLDEAEFRRQYASIAEAVFGTSVTVLCESKTFRLAEQREKRKLALGFHEEAHAH